MHNTYVAATVRHRAGRTRDYDEFAVELAVEGKRVPLAPLELREAIRRYDTAGRSARDVALWLGTTMRAVQRDRQRRRLACTGSLT